MATERPTVEYRRKPTVFDDGSTVHKVPTDLTRYAHGFRSHPQWGKYGNRLHGPALDAALVRCGVMNSVRTLNTTHPAVTISDEFMPTIVIDFTDLWWKD